jgi:hypothetical protein
VDEENASYRILGRALRPRPSAARAEKNEVDPRNEDGPIPEARVEVCAQGLLQEAGQSFLNPRRGRVAQTGAQRPDINLDASEPDGGLRERGSRSEDHGRDS